jgi:glycine cleavage system H lipoate-binding protein
MTSIARTASARFALPSDRLYMPDRHVWAQMQDGIASIGITAPLREVVSFSPEVGFWAVDRVGVGDTLATVSGREDHIVAIAAPVAGALIDLNPLLERAPQALLGQPYRLGWVARVAPENWERDAARLVDPGRYREALERELGVGRDLCFGGAVLAPVRP